MSRRRARGNPVDGVLLLNKPAGITSQTAVTRVRTLYGAAKAGHTGTLDPLAEGLLPVCLGEATKFSQGLLDADKGYRAVVRLGVVTATGDLEGEVLDERPADVTPAEIAEAVERFRGDIEQVPPMYSALKRDGKPLYAYARAGEDIERLPRKVHIARIEIQDIAGADVTLEVVCSKGTYVRVLAEDLGKALGCGACLARLTRTSVGPYRVDQAVTLQDLQAVDLLYRLRLLLPADTLVAAFPRMDLSAAEAGRLASGIPLLRAPGEPETLFRAYGPDGRFLGLAASEADGRVVPRRLVSSEPRPAPANAGNGSKA